MGNRRDFIKQASVGAAAMALPTAGLAFAPAKTASDDQPRVILFQGDSITDGNRTRNNDWNHVMGHGYAYLVASRLWYDYPKKDFHFFNRGVSGNRVPDLLQRWDTDTIAIKPDLLSILIGINETDIEVKGNTSSTPDGYEQDYRKLLQQTKAALPDVRLVICEPFTLPVGRVKDKFDAYTKALVPRQAIAKKLADEFGAIFIPYQQIFNEALDRAPADYWIWDGIHPMPAGHELMARQWIKYVHKQIPFIG